MRLSAARLSASVRRRKRSALLVGVLAAIVTATTPILIRAVQQSALEHALTSVPTLQRSVIGNASSNDRITSSQAGARAGDVTAALRRAPFWTAARTYREQNDLPLTWTVPQPSAGRPAGRPKQRIADIPGPATRTRVLAAIDELHYVPNEAARALRASRRNPDGWS